MATTSNQNLSLGKLKRAVDGTNSYTTANTSLGAQNDGSSQTKMSDFSISSVDSVTGFTYLWEQTSETYTMNFSNNGSLFLSKIANRADNFSWSENSGVTSISGDYTATLTAGAISNANTGTGDDSDFFPAGSNNASVTVTGKFTEDGQSDGFNDHATNYNSNLTKAVTVVDSYGGSPSCLLEGTDIQLIDQLDEDEENWRSCRFPDEKTETFTQHTASVQDINFDFAYNYWDINGGKERITGEHEMLYKPIGEDTWMWQLVPNMKVGAHLMDKDGNEVEITSLENVIENSEGFEVVQIDVEPLDVYFGSTFLVHNKGSNSDPF